MSFPPTQASIQCPQCGQPLTMSIQQVIDVGQEPALRDRLLRGRLNVLRCPHCKVSGPIAAPMVYHDPDRELLLAFIPHQMQLTMEEEEKEIGRLTNFVLNNTPQEKRKAYLLNPTRVITYDGLVEKILEAEGISPDQMRQQTEKIQLVMKLAQAVGDDQRLAALIEEHREQIDYNFLTLVTMTMQQAAEVHDEPTVNRYGTLRETIIKQLDLDSDQIPSLGIEEQVDGLIDSLLETPADRLQAAVASNRPLMDYEFFLHLSRRAEQSEGAEKERLMGLRQRLLEITDEMDRMAKEAMERGAQQLQEMLQAEDVDAKIKEMYEELDEGFLVVLSANVEAAKAQGREEVVEALMRIYSRVVHAMEDRLRPELRAVNQLLRMESSEERKARLREELRTYNPAGFVEMVEAIAGDLENAGRQDPAVLDRLYEIADEARELIATELNDFVPPTQKLFHEEQGEQNGGDQPGIVLP